MLLIHSPKCLCIPLEDLCMMFLRHYTPDFSFIVLSSVFGTECYMVFCITTDAAIINIHLFRSE